MKIRLSLGVTLFGRAEFFSHFCPVMFERLKKRWKVSGWQLVLVLCTFATGGTLTAWAGKRILNLLNIQADWLWSVIYILLITLIWPLAVLIVSIPLGQFRFFANYIHKIGVKIGLTKEEE